MLYAKLRLCVHTYTKATYDVHAVFSVHICIYIWCTRHFSVHVCHSHMDRLICSLLCDCLFPPLFSSFCFWCIETVYTALCNCLEFHWNMTYDTWFPGYWTFQQIYIRYILHIDGNSDIFISRGWYSKVYAFYFILILYDCALMFTHFHCIYSVYTVYIVCWHSHMGFHVYEMYTYSVYNMYTSGFTFLGWLYDNETFMLFLT